MCLPPKQNCLGNLLHFICLKLIVVRESKTWEEALEYCREQHTDLTSLVSEKELLLAQRESREAQTTTAHLWTGLRYLANRWLWVNGNPLEYEAWPQGGQHQCPAWNLHCGAMATEGAWETRDCQENLNFICY
uniref:C-type lectin domain-containing protein n=1 Tax=Oncorhynchus tshawytscha TaxID=74940 RepID=A0A8C8GQH3_ONCTS